MISDDLDFLYDDTEQTYTRFVCFSTSTHRYDLAITSSDRFFGKKMVTDIQGGRTAIMGPDDLKEEGYLEHTFQVSKEEADTMQEFLIEVIGSVNFTDF